MEENLFKQHMRAFDRWKAELIQVIRDYHHWLESHEQSSPEVDLRLFDSIEALKSDHLTIAFVAEFSRGKTELINSIFFSDYKRRLLPSEPGRTTMCPTELFYDHQEDQAYIRLLPIETRLQDSSISDLKLDTSQWKTINLDVNSPDQMVEALREVVKTKQVSLEIAESLGLYNIADNPRRRRTDEPPPTEIEIPQWRHATISFPHPLLQQGLSILDTPGLNALGTEPELTINMLPNAHAVLFILAADTGVTRSDLEVWEHHIREFRGSNKTGLVAAVNKIDTLWDELKDEEEINRMIESQRMDVAAALEIDQSQVFPISAQKSLVAKTRNDDELLKRSRLPELERYLAEKVIPAKQTIVRDNIVSEVGKLIRDSQKAIRSELTTVKGQLKDLGSLSGKNSHLIQHMMRKAREKQADYNQNMEYFQSSRRTLNQHATLLFNELSLKKFDKVASEARDKMASTWTTGGLKTGMTSLFDGIKETIAIAARHADETHSQIIDIYQRFNKESELESVIDPKPFSTDVYLKEMEKLYEQADEFRNSPVTTMTEQSFVIKKFFISLVTHARDIFYQANQEAETWFKDIMVPLAKHVTDNKRILEQHMETLYKVNESKETLSSQTTELKDRCRELISQFETLKKIRSNLDAPAPGLSDEAKVKEA